MFYIQVMICCESLFLYHAAFLKERNTVAKNLIVVILIFLRVHPIINLLQGYMQRLRSILTMAFGSFGLETIVYSTFSIKTILMYYFISFERNLKKRLSAKLRKQKQSATTIFAERRLLNYENME